MNDTTKWIMIILLLLLIGAAVFMLLRSPGKENGAVDVPPTDTDRDGVPETRADAVPAAEHGVYDQDAEVAPVEPVDERPYDEPTVDERPYDEPTVDERPYDEPVTADEGAAPETYEPQAAAPTSDETVADEAVMDDAVADDGAEPYRPEAGAQEAGGTHAGWDADGPDVAQAAAVGAAGAAGGAALAASATDEEPVDEARIETVEVDEAPAETAPAETAPAETAPAETVDEPVAEGARPLSEDEIEAGGREEPLDVDDQEPGVAVDEPAGGGWDPDGPDVGQAAAVGAAAAGGAAVAGARGTDETVVEETVVEETVVEEPVAEEPVAEEPRPVAEEPVFEEPGSFHQETLPTDEAPAEEDAPAEEYPVGEESTTYRADGGSAVRVDEPAAEGTSGPEEAAGRGAGYETVDDRGSEVAAGDSAPADAGYGTPETADDIATGAVPEPAVPETATPEAAPAETAPAETAPPADTGYAPVFAESAYGSGSAEPLEDGSGPAGWEIKGNAGSMLFHTPESPSYDGVRAEVWFESEEAARAAGFAHWDRRRR